MSMNPPQSVDECFNELASIGAKVSIIARSPVPLVVIGWEGSLMDERLGAGLAFALADLAGERNRQPMRCVTIQHLPNVLRFGCDVEPSDSVFWVTRSPGKALEYGGDTKIMLAFNDAKLVPTFREIPADTPAMELEQLRLTYPTVIPSEDGKKLWLTRLQANDKRINTFYEAEYGRWIPGDPWQALLAVIVLGLEQAKPMLVGASIS